MRERSQHKNRTAVVTGASSGIGRAIVRCLANQGRSVLGTGRRAIELSALVDELGDGVITRVAELTEDGVLKRLLVEAEGHFGQPPSVVVLSAGRGLRGTLLSSDQKEWQALLEINYLSIMRQMRDTAGYMASNVEHHAVQDIVVIGSTVGRQVSALNSVYGSTKFAVHSLVESLRQEVCNSYIRVTLIEPGFVKSGFQDVAGYDRKWFAALEQESGPFLLPDDVAAIVSYVVSQPPHVHLDDVRVRPTRQRV